MAVDAFSKWKVNELKKFLRDRGAVISGRKAELVEKASILWKSLKLQKKKKM